LQKKKTSLSRQRAKRFLYYEKLKQHYSCKQF
jgi:hypothetical protein